MRITYASPDAIRYACMNFHYAKAIPSVRVGYNIYNDDDEWCGVICYGGGATPHIATPFNKWQGQVLELVRVALNGKQGTTSQAVAMTLKQLQKDCPAVDVVVSYADLDQAHAGTIYQATNWIYAGLTNADTRGAFIIHGKKTHPKTVYSRGWKQSILWLRENVDANAEEFITKGKHKYIFPFGKKMRKRLAALSQPYPKKETETEETPPHPS